MEALCLCMHVSIALHGENACMFPPPPPPFNRLPPAGICIPLYTVHVALTCTIIPRNVDLLVNKLTKLLL